MAFLNDPRLMLPLIAFVAWVRERRRHRQG
jgi:hypothetical protein